MNVKEFYEIENKVILEGYKESLKSIENMCKEIKTYMDGNEEGKKSLEEYSFYEFLKHTGEFLIKVSDLEENLNEEHFSKKSFEELKAENNSFYSEIIGDKYEKSYGNPTYTVGVFGDEIGKLLSAFYAMCLDAIEYAYKHRVFNIYKINSTLLKVYENIKNGKITSSNLKKIIFDFDEEWMFKNQYYRRQERSSQNFTFYLNTILNEDLTDPKYLFRFGKYISSVEIETARFLAKYPKEKIEKLSKNTVSAYIRGFDVENKKRGNRNSVEILYRAGQEIIIKELIKEFKAKGFNSTILKIESTEPNKQYTYDHRFDNGLYLDEEYIKLRQKVEERVCKACEKEFSVQAGPMVFESFGEIPFSPENKKESIKLTKDQQDLSRKFINGLRQLINKYEPEENTCFSIIAFPTAEIGEKFKEIFDEVFDINMMDNSVYEVIQQKIIDALDEGEYVHVKGKGENKTDIKVKLQELKDKKKETNFVNCVADVNIPLGEVFTSPMLKGTNGLLHLRHTYLGLKYTDLCLTFKDGFVSEYTCKNFENEEDNKTYVKENLMQFHDTLPLGEFAIGTNTKAYVMAEKYDIIEKLPILIIEKMGPHFAIGDTCFSYAEDLPIYNMLDNKEITARENEKTALRKKDMNKAYTSVHTDITLPYEEIEFISVVSKSGKYIDIIRDGRFALEGTSKLNEAFKK
ncbi:aminopeptidase [Haloimpatiens sp. FM7315]|uniref:aminopeptidase n=1 Tax=Haloimpatiens sp. FM7315 TaxID=3298609 RepID=UPI00370A0F6B